MHLEIQSDIKTHVRNGSSAVLAKDMTQFQRKGLDSVFAAPWLGSGSAVPGLDGVSSVEFTRAQIGEMVVLLERITM